jgi:hypothetical protein
MLIFNCHTCKKEFTSIKACKSRIPKYCSRECYAKREITEDWLKKISDIKKGKATWNKGVKMWEGKEHPRGTLGMKFPEKSGEKSIFWKGGVSTKNELARKSPEYKSWRTSVFTRDNYTCVHCGKIGGKLQADHIKPFCKYIELRFDINNGRTLCTNCHYKTDTYGSKMLKYEYL